jgi:hypothetical protein
MEPDAMGDGAKVELRWPLPNGAWAGCEFNLYIPVVEGEEADDLLAEMEAELAAQVMDAFDVPRVLVYEQGVLSVEVTSDEDEDDEENDR